MEVTKPGSYSTYLYNITTGKLSTKTGEHDKFVDWYNGELSDDDVADEFNGYDSRKKEHIQDFFHDACRENGALWNAAAGKFCREANGGDVEITYHVKDIVTSEWIMNGKTVLTGYEGVCYTQQELDKIYYNTSPLKTTMSKPYNAADNSISIAIGDEFDLGNGYRLRVNSDMVEVYGCGNGSETERKNALALAHAMTRFLRFADQLDSTSWEDFETPFILEFLHRLGVDTGRKFTVNETECEIRDGRIEEVQYDYGGENIGSVPSTIWRGVMERVGKEMLMPLSQRWGKFERKHG